MPTGTAGDSARAFSYQMVHYLRKEVTFSNRGTAVTIGKIPVNAVVLPHMSGALVTTAFNGSGTDLLDIGTSDDDDGFATDLDVSSVGFKVCDETATTNDAIKTTGTMTITATYADANSDATAGSAEVIICYIPDNDG